MQQILVCNCGSSSVKIDIFEIQNNKPKFLAAISAGRVGTPDCRLRIKIPNQKIKDDDIRLPGLDHKQVITKISELLKDYNLFLPEQRFAVGHRIVHGAHFISEPVFLNDVNIETVKRCIEYAPLHNPVNILGIEICAKIFEVPQVGVFDTAFHQSISERAHTYALPSHLIKKYNIRRYGFHGTSHEYVSRQAAQFINRDYDKFTCISLHLGNGASVCAISNGKSVETSMGFTPLEGLVMGSRCGDLDPALVAFLCEKESFNTDQIDTLLNKKSGLVGICGKSDMRDILKSADDGDVNAKLARDVFCWRIKKYIGAYLAVLNGTDTIIFTGGIGENSAQIRRLCLDNLDNLGIILDEQKNQKPQTHNWQIQKNADKTAIIVIPTDEEWMIADKTLELIKKN